MTFECATCHARYKIDDSIIPPAGARVRCRGCGAVLVIRPPVTEIKPVDLELIPSAEEPLPLEPRRPAPAPAPARPRPQASSPSVPAAESFIERFTAPSPSEIPQDPMVERWGTPAGGPSIERTDTASIPPAPPAPQAPPPLRSESDNVVPLSFGTPIPEGLSPQERARHEKARRLARVLASDIAVYNREKRDRGLQEGNLIAVLGYEIKKSWETYKERVGADFANSTPYFRDALNELLAEGKKLF